MGLGKKLTWAGAAALSIVAAQPVWAPHARAFCGFYVSSGSGELINNATQVALMRQGLRTVLTMSNTYHGPPQDFAMVVPVPVVLQQDNVRTLPPNVFEHIEALTAPRLVEYWEQDPCQPEARYDGIPMPSAAVQTEAGATGAGGGDLGVRIEAQFVVGEYQIVVLSASQSTGLETWLHLNHYNIPDGAAEFLAPYVREQSKFFVARVDIQRVHRDTHGDVVLSPLRFHYDTQEFRLPVRLGLLNAGNAQDLIVYILSPSTRYEVANYTDVFIPTNIEVRDNVRQSFPAFYAALFDSTIRAAGGRAVVTEYSWSSSSCDPCPTPPLEASELATLGLDVLGPPGETQSWAYSMTLTRMHTRYDRATLTEDLVFREAPAVVGGREFVVDPQSGQLEQGARREGGENNFQGRYAIRHRWTGAVACNDPHRGVWGGPPGGGEPPPPAPARDLANAPRGGTDLSAMVASPIPGIVTGTGQTIAAPQSMQPGAVGRGPRGCACETAPGAPLALGGLATAGAAFALTVFIRRRSRRRR